MQRLRQGDGFKYQNEESYIKYFETIVLCHKDEDKRVDRVEPSA